MLRVDKKIEAAQAIEKYFRNTSVAPDDVNNLLESKNSAKLTQKVRLHAVLARPHITIQELSATVPFVGDYLKDFEDEFVTKDAMIPHLKHDRFYV